MYLNTNKEQFLGKHPFTAPAMDAKTFHNQFINIIKNIGKQHNIDDIEDFFNNPNYTESEQILLSLYALTHQTDFIPEMQALNQTLDAFGYYQADNIMPFVDIEQSYNNNGDIITLDNGFSYIQYYCGFGDDAYLPCLIAFYIDENSCINAYIPYYGNFISAECNHATLAEICIGTYPRQVDSLYYEFEDQMQQLKLHYEYEDDDEGESLIDIIYPYGLKYGMEDSPASTIEQFLQSHDISQDIQYDMLTISSDYCKMDIASNVKILR